MDTERQPPAGSERAVERGAATELRVCPQLARVMAAGESKCGKFGRHALEALLEHVERLVRHRVVSERRRCLVKDAAWLPAIAPSDEAAFGIGCTLVDRRQA